MFVDTASVSELVAAFSTGEVLFLHVHALNVVMQQLLCLKLFITCRTCVASDIVMEVFYCWYFRLIRTSNLLFLIFCFSELRVGLTLYVLVLTAHSTHFTSLC